MLQLFSRHDFERAVREHQAERHARGFTCWGQFVAMLFCQLGRAQWLREICGGLAASEGKLRHRGLPDAPRRSTLAYANEHRPWQLYQSTLVFLTNHRRFAASTIARIYKSRWQIELFFKALKQNLRIKTFVGASENALQIQIWTALIAMLVLKYLQLRSRFAWSLSNLAALLRQQLFVYRDLWLWIDQPFQPPPLLDHRRPANLLFLVRQFGQQNRQPQLSNRRRSLKMPRLSLCRSLTSG